MGIVIQMFQELLEIFRSFIEQLDKNQARRPVSSRKFCYFLLIIDRKSVV